MDESEFRRWADLLRERTGMGLPSTRKAFRAAVIEPRLRQLGLAIAEALASRLRFGATLVFGAGELIGWRRSDMQRIGGVEVLAYRRRKT